MRTGQARQGLFTSFFFFHYRNNIDEKEALECGDSPHSISCGKIPVHSYAFLRMEYIETIADLMVAVNS